MGTAIKVCALEHILWSDMEECEPLVPGPPSAQRLPDPQEDETLRRKIKYFFMNPCEKYHARGRKPWKLVLQIIKIAIITAQVTTRRLSTSIHIEGLL